MTVEPGLDARLIRRLRAARLALWWERLWPGLWPATGIAGLFVAIAWTDWLPLLPGAPHAALLALTGLALAAALWRGLHGLRWPGEAAARRRLERDSGVAHRPLGTLADHPAEDPLDPLGQELWGLHRRRMAASLARLRVAWPSPGLPARDPWGLRAGVLLLMVIAGAGAWGDLVSPLGRAVRPALAGSGPGLDVQVWITPPAYTGAAPVFLATANQPPGTPLTVPAGSAVLALVQDAGRPAVLRAGDATIPFTRLDERGQRAEGKLAAGRRLAVEVGGREVAGWPVAVVPDSPPTIAFTTPPEPDERGRLHVQFEATDDYGLAKAWVTVRRIDQAGSPPVVVDLPLAGGHGHGAATGRGEAWLDLSAHPWAGLPVTLTPAARDEAGLTGEGQAVRTVLPERVFHHPVARAIAEQRRMLAAEPDRRGDVVVGLDAISGRPDLFSGDIIVFLALRVARAQLVDDDGPDAVAPVMDLMWNAALRVEEGNLPTAETALDDASRALEKALAENAPEAEIDRLMSQLQSALQDYLRALAENAVKSGNISPPPPDAQTISGRELADMIQRMRDMARTGSRDAARQMLSDLQEMLRGLQMRPQGGAAGAAARQQLDKLQELARRQQQLLDNGFQRTQHGQATTSPDQDAEAQEQLRRALGEAMRGLGETLGEIPPALGEAEQAMRDAVTGLREGDDPAAAQAEGDALDGLQRGARAALDQLARRFGPGAGLAEGPGFGRDPFGRPLPPGAGNLDDRTVHIPEQAELGRARDILDELRRRAGQPRRPAVERDYLQRLLQQF